MPTIAAEADLIKQARAGDKKAAARLTQQAMSGIETGVKSCNLFGWDITVEDYNRQTRETHESICREYENDTNTYKLSGCDKPFKPAKETPKQFLQKYSKMFAEFCPLSGRDAVDCEALRERAWEKGGQ